jgi:hypothetical protein
MGSMEGTFTIPEFNSSYTITDSNLVRIGDKKFLEKTMYSPLLSNFHFEFYTENHFFVLNAHSSHSKKMGSMGGTFTIPEFNSSYTITDSNLVRIGDKKFLEKNHVLPPSI